MKKYLILGKSGAGSLIPEFLFAELGIEYEIQFTNKKELTVEGNKGYNPLGKIPVLILPDGVEIFESLAIVNYITNKYSGLLPDKNSLEHLKYWQILGLLSSTVYSAYHRQHHSYRYVDNGSYEILRLKAKNEQSIIYDYLEKMLNPYICGEQITAVDFYMYTLTRWDLDKTKLREGRPKLTYFLKEIRSRNSVDMVLKNQPKYLK